MKKLTPLKIPTDHPAFAGHFPGTPIVPGVVLLDEVIHAVAADTGFSAKAWQVSSVKFLSPLKPGEAVVIELKQLVNGTVKFEVLEGSRQIVTGSFVLTNKVS